MQRYANSLCLAFIALLLSGCAGFVKSNVTVFHILPPQETRTKYSFIPLQSQESSLEYATYQNYIRNEFSKFNYQEVPLEDASVIVAFEYGMGGSREKIVSIPIYGQTGVSSATTHGSVNTYGNYGTFTARTTFTPTYGFTGSQTYSKTEHTRNLWLYIVDKSSLISGKSKVLYEAAVQSEGSSGQLVKVMPAMVKALFNKFPGESGSTRLEIVPLEIK